jgi:ribonuclease G
MQAAFVDIGLEKAAFMHVSDFWPRSPEGSSGEGPEGVDPLEAARDVDIEASLLAYVDELVDVDKAEGGEEAAEEEDGAGDLATESDLLAATDGPAEDDAVADEETGIDEASRALGDAVDAPPDARPPRAQPLRAIEDALQKGQEIVVQISKEPIGSKGARITSHISLPGRYVVYMPTTEHIGVSRRIEDERERKRLREIVASGRPPHAGGFIVRTACEGVSKREITADMRFLVRLWDRILKRGSGTPAPALLHEDLDIVLRAVRDLFTSDVAEVTVDRAHDHARIVEFIDGVLQPKLQIAHPPARRRDSDLRSLRHREPGAARPRAPRLAQVGRLSRVRSDRGADRDRREHRPIRRKAYPRGDRPQDQPRGGSCGDRPAPPAQHRGHHHH